MISSQALRIPGGASVSGASCGAAGGWGLTVSVPVPVDRYKGGATPVACTVTRTNPSCARATVSAAHLSQGMRVRSSVTTTAHVPSRSGTISSSSSPTFGTRPFSLETRFRVPATPCAPLVGRGSARKGDARNKTARNSLAEGQGMGEVVKSRVTRAQENLDAFVRFTRPHTMIGTTISIVSVSLLAAASVADLNTRFLVGLLQAVVPALLANVYIVGLNQLFDIDIDKVNKPYLPLASGDFSVQTGVTIVAVCAVLSLALGILSGSMPLLATLVISMLLGTAYSIDLPFLRWKRFPVMAASCILAVRAVIVQLGFYSHMQMAVMQRSLQLSSQLVFATAFMCTFSIVIALFKDVPDVEGDRVFGIRSLSVRVGQKKVYWFCVSILLASYAAATIMGLTSSMLWSKILSVVTHVGAATALWRVASSADLSSQQDITDVYMFIWKPLLNYHPLPSLTPDRLPSICSPLYSHSLCSCNSIHFPSLFPCDGPLHTAIPPRIPLHPLLEMKNALLPSFSHLNIYLRDPSSLSPRNALSTQLFYLEYLFIPFLR
ncbi:unnamed protein product [Closterium sp. NIES-53]